MQATQDTERTYHITLDMGGKKQYNTKHTYTREQAEEISEIAAESARVAAGSNSQIRNEPLKVMGD